MQKNLGHELGRLSTHLALEQRFATDHASKKHSAESLERIEHDLEIVTELIQILEQTTDREVEEEALTRANSLLERWARDPDQAWCEKVIDGRFTHHVSVYNHRTINHPAMKPLVAEQLREATDRTKTANELGFRFEGFAQVLTRAGFWQHVGTRIEERWQVQRDWPTFVLTLEDPDYTVFLNILNGAGEIDYEAAFPELTHALTQIKKYKFHTQTPVEVELPSSVSTADILCSLFIDRLNEDMNAQQKRTVELMAAKVLDNQVSNQQHKEMYWKLDDIYHEFPSGHTIIANALAQAEQEMRLPAEHEGACESLESLSDHGVDAVITLFGGGCGMESYEARRVLARYPQAFAMPSGGKTPHEAKAGQEHAAGQAWTEADLMTAILLREDYQEPYEGFPDYEPNSDLPPIQGYEVLVAEGASIDTKTNAINMKTRLQALQELKDGEPLTVVLVTTHQHAARAWAEFRSILPRNLVVNLKVWTQDTSPILTKVVEKRKPVGIGNLVADYLKRLYLVSVK